MSIVRLYNCPYFINGESSLRPDSDVILTGCVPKFAVTHCPKGRAYCHIDVDTDNWSKGTLEIIRILVKGWRRKGNGNVGEIVEIIEQILRRQDDMKCDLLDALCVSRKWFDEKQAEARQKGREEAWDLARRIVVTGDGCYTIDEVNKVFGNMNILRTPIDEVLAKDKEYQEEKKALHIGDEVEFIGSNPNYKVKVNELMTGYVVGFEDGLSDECSVRILTKHGTYLRSREMCEKTGKHNPDVEEVMASFEKGEGK